MGQRGLRARESWWGGAAATAPQDPQSFVGGPCSCTSPWGLQLALGFLPHQPQGAPHCVRRRRDPRPDRQAGPRRARDPQMLTKTRHDRQAPKTRGHLCLRRGGGAHRHEGAHTGTREPTQAQGGSRCWGLLQARGQEAVRCRMGQDSTSQSRRGHRDPPRTPLGQHSLSPPPGHRDAPGTPAPGSPSPSLPGSPPNPNADASSDSSTAPVVPTGTEPLPAGSLATTCLCSELGWG